MIELAIELERRQRLLCERRQDAIATLRMDPRPHKLTATDGASHHADGAVGWEFAVMPRGWCHPPRGWGGGVALSRYAKTKTMRAVLAE